MNLLLPSLLVSAVLGAGDARTVSHEVSEIHPVEVRLVELTNQQRKRHGLRPLKLDLRLLRSARRHTNWMVRSGNFQHTSAGVAENIAMGQANSDEAMNSWMNSSGHRANILSAGYTRIGVAAYTAPNGTVYWCQQFH